VTQPFVGEIRMFGGSFAPLNWALCSGQLIQISQYQELFALIGTTYGGDGFQTFGLPDLRGRFPVHQGVGGGQTVVMGQSAGTEAVQLTPGQMPVHTHQLSGSSMASSQSPANAVPAEWGSAQYSTSSPAAASLLPSAVGVAGGSAPHENRSPYLAVNYIIALVGIFPSRG
jgi:microcystin-dependent protein